MSHNSKTIQGYLWNAVEIFGGKLSQLFITIILARFLDPNVFGIIALLLVFSELSKVIIDSGFTQALIRDNNVSEEDYSTIFFLNIIIGISLYVLLYILAPLIGNYYDNLDLIQISRIVFLSIIFNSFSVVQNARLIKNVDFRILAKRTLFSNITAGIIAIILAYFGFGIWSLVFQFVFLSFIRTVLLWISVKWRPLIVFRFETIKKYFSFSVNLLLSGIIDVLVSNLQILIIGKYYSKADLGFYNQAKQISSVSYANLTSVIQNVSYPILSKFQHELSVLKDNYINTIKNSLLLVFPMMVFLALNSESIITLLLGEKWIQSVEYFKIFCFAGAIFPLYTLGLNIIKIKGNGSNFLIVSALKRVVTVVVVLITMNFGIIWIAKGFLISIVINSFITMYFSGKEIEYSLLNQFKDIFRIIFTTLCCVIFLYYTVMQLSFPYILLELVCNFVFFYIIFYLITRIIKVRELDLFIHSVKNKLGK